MTFAYKGGDSGIGRAVALAFAREGATIVISYLNEHEDAQEIQKAVEQAGRECILLVRLRTNCIYMSASILGLRPISDWPSPLCNLQFGFLLLIYIFIF